MTTYLRLTFLLILMGSCVPPLVNAAISIAPEANSPQVRYALGKLSAELRATPADLRVELTPAAEISPDGFRLHHEGATLVISGGDTRGAMYGLLDVAGQLKTGRSLATITDRTEAARLSFRAIKFNLPFGAYRTAPSIELHQDTCLDPKFWEAFLDMMAANRFNSLTLWGLHPFTYLVVPKSFPEAQSFSDQQMVKWRTFWTKLFALAKERGIDTYLINWNTFVSPDFARAQGIAPYSIDLDHIGRGSPADPLITTYTRECVQQVIDEYPDLTGLGITLGERMGEQSPAERRAWIQDTFIAGIAAAHRPIKFIYRAPLSADKQSGGTTSEENDRLSRQQIEAIAKQPNIIAPVYVEFKFNWSHGHSSPELFLVHGGKLSDAYWNPAPQDYRIVWTVRNEDIQVLRWGSSEFVRAFVEHNATAPTAGALIGSEVFIPAKDYMTNVGKHRSWDYFFERNWLGWTTWGRLLHTPTTPDRYFADELGARFGHANGPDLQRAWELASRTPLKFAAFHQGRNDLTLYTEAFSAWRERGGTWQFFDIDSFIQHPVLDTRRYVNIADFVRTGGQLAPGQISPLQLANELDHDLTEVTRLVAAVRARGAVSPTADCELTDLECWVQWGGYFAAKLRGGVALATFRQSQPVAGTPCTEAVTQLEIARTHWKKLAALGTRYNWPRIVFHTSAPFSWAGFLPAIEQDIAIAQGNAAPHRRKPADSNP